MYIGNTNISGVKNLIGYVLDDLQAETETQIRIELNPFDRIQITASSVTISELKADILKFAPNPYTKWSLFVLIALSEAILILISDSKSTIELTAQKGNHQLKETALPAASNTLFVDFKLDPSIFKETNLNYEVVNHLFRQYAFLNPGIEITSIDNRSKIQQCSTFYYPQGVSQELDYWLGTNKTYASPHFRLDLKTVLNNFSYQFSFVLLAHGYDQSYVVTYANSEELVFGGSFIDGILEGTYDSIKNLAKHHQKEITFSRQKLKSRLILIASAQVVDKQKSHFKYGGSIRGWLEMPKLKRDVKKYVSEQLNTYFNNNKPVADSILDDFQKWEKWW